MPDNRDPHSDEITMWKPVLDAEIERVAPSVIVTLGNGTTRALLDTNEKISDKHGEYFERDDRMTIPTYHPASMFYDDRIKKAIEEDMQTAAKKAELLTM
ncbi:uracil-DNA glycosylase family protein [Halocatena marina]|uniref:uracil-DNA glycosylase family protein n=1 Tax=Halocatena marina TaxID=2934937 RepID=UPI00200F5D2C|nr:uracil-DNA glycosylase family protein [Halocatena marina]